MKELYQIFPATKWRDFGLMLNIPLHELNAIRHNHMNAGGVQDCLSDTLEKWYNRNPDVTWGEICAALQKIHEESLATQLARKHGKHLSICTIV